MKKLNLAFSCLFLFALGTSIAMADEEKSTGGPGLRLGVEAGANFASLNGPNTSYVYENRLGFVGGAFVNFSLGSSLAIQPEFLYAQKGGKINGNDYQLNYFEVPVLLNVTLVGPLSVLAGPSFNAVVSNNNLTNVNNTDTGLILGAQVEFGPLLVTGRYEIGINDVNTDQQLHNGTFTFMGGLSFI